MSLREIGNSGKAETMLDKLSGSVIIAQTPFDDCGAVDLESIDTLTDFYLKHGRTASSCSASAARDLGWRPRKPWKSRRASSRARTASRSSLGSAIRVRRN